MIMSIIGECLCDKICSPLLLTVCCILSFESLCVWWELGLYSRTPRSRSSRDDDSYQRGGRYGPPTRTDYRVLVENLSSRISWQDLKDYMRRAGEACYADAHKQRRNEGRCISFASTWPCINKCKYTANELFWFLSFGCIEIFFTWLSGLFQVRNEMS